MREEGEEGEGDGGMEEMGEIEENMQVISMNTSNGTKKEDDFDINVNV